MVNVENFDRVTPDRIEKTIGIAPERNGTDRRLIDHARSFPAKR
jgi:hypothetical protein